MRRRRRPARSTRAANWATPRPCHGRRVRRSGPHGGLRDRRRRGGDRRARHELAFAPVPRARRATASCCRSCISTATGSPRRRSWGGCRTRTLAAMFAGLGWSPAVVAGDDPARMHADMADALDRALDAAGRLADRRGHTSADDRASQRPRAGPGPNASTATPWKGRSGPIRCRSAAFATLRTIARSWNVGCAATTPPTCSPTVDPNADILRSRPRVRGGSGRTRMPTADGCSSPSVCPIRATMR